MLRRLVSLGVVVVAGLAASSASGDARLPTHAEVTGSEIVTPDVRPAGGAWTAMAWSDLAHTTFEPGRYEVRLRAVAGPSDDAIQIPTCAGRTTVRVDARVVSEGSAGPLVVPVTPGPHEVVIALDVSRYERRIACGEPPRLGHVDQTISGLGTLVFDSPSAARGGGKAVVYVPPGFNPHQTSAVLVGLHPWNGGIWTYAAYEELLREARIRGVLLLMPSGLGNSLYTADAEDEVLRAIDALVSVIESGDAPHPLNVSLWGASMGGAGATTIGFHHPDHFATITSLFGDSSYDLSTYVHAILPDARAAHRVNALDVVDNVRNLPVWLIHGEDDRTSPIRQSEILARALQERGYTVRFDRVPGIGHAGALVARFLPDIVAAAATARTTTAPTRVTYRGVRPTDVAVYNLYIERTDATGDTLIDLESRPDGIHVLHATGVRQIGIRFGALRTSCHHLPPVVIDDPAATVAVTGIGSTCL